MSEHYFVPGFDDQGNAKNVRIEVNAFKPSSYAGIITSSDTGAVFAIATGVVRVMFQNLNAVVAEHAIVAFGTSVTSAQANLSIVSDVAMTGAIIPTTQVTGSPTGPPVILDVPVLATHVAIGHSSTGADNNVMVIQGV